MPGGARARCAPRRPLLRFLQDQTGAGSAFGLFGVLICVMFAGVSIDFTNAWRHREILRLSADVAAHAGASVLAEEGSRMAALAVATGATELNTPVRSYGRTIGDPFQDIQALEYDPDTNRLKPGTEPNAVSVHLQRSARVQNPVPTFLLRLIGRKSWDISVTSVAAVVPTERCGSGDGLYAHDRLTLGGQASVGKDVCLHSQKRIDLPGQSGFDAGAWLSLPDMADCRGGCNATSTAGFDAAAIEANLIMTPPAELIDRLATAFSDERRTLPEEDAFFDRHPLAEDLTMLDELGVKTEELKTGDVVRLTSEEADRARGLPAGLVYLVTCSGNGEGSGILSLGGIPAEVAADGIEDTASGGDEAPGGGGGGEGEALPADFFGDDALSDPGDPPGEAPDPALQEGSGQLLTGIVLVTDCLLHFTDQADVRGSLILSTRAVSGPALTADALASAGDPQGTCAPGMQSVIMARGRMEVPARFTASNTAFVIDGPVTVAGEPMGAMALHRGLSIHASGPIQMLGENGFSACDTAPTVLLPALEVIKFVVPTEPLKGTQ